MTEQIISVYKPIGLTPLQTIKKLQLQKPEISKQKITFAGRLDPLAHGVLLLLAGKAIQNKENYLSLKKTYEFTVLFGLETDTYDLLGYLKRLHIKPIPINVNTIVNTFVNNYLGKKQQQYPPYSSKTVKGKPLFWWAKNNKLMEIIIPTHEVEIYSMQILKTGEISITKLEKLVKQYVKSVQGDFRQKKILSRWDEFFTSQKKSTQTLLTVTFSVSCSSGTYVREMVHQMGKNIGSGGIALDILRTAIGDYQLNTSVMEILK